MQNILQSSVRFALSSKACAAALVVGGFFPAANWAQDAESRLQPIAQVSDTSTSGTEAEKDGALTEIVVTAQFREQRLQDTPIAITALTAEMLEARSQNTLTEIGRNIPNVTLQPSISAYGGTAAIYIRGVGQFDRDFALEPGVGVYIDDVYYPTVYGAQLDLLDLDRVEVLRGPQGTLAGKNSIGGAVKLYSKKPTGDGGGFIEGTIGSFSRTDLRATSDFALSDTVTARLSGVYKKREGYVDRIDFKCRHPESPAPTVATDMDCKVGTEGGQDFKGARLIVRWDASDRFDVTLSGDIYSDDSEPSPSRLIAVRPDHASAPLLTPFLDVGRYESYSLYQSQRGYGLAGRNRLDGYGVSGQLNYDFSDNLTLTSISAYRTYDGFFQVDLDGTSYGMTTQHVGLDFEQFSQELRVNGSLAGGRLDYTVGGYFYSGRGASAGLIELTFQAVNPPAPPPPAASFHIQDDIVEIENKSAFLHTIFRATDALTLSLGIRYTDEWKTLVLHRKDPVTLEFQPLEGANGRFDGDHVDYRVSLDYRWNPNLLTYVSFATGFKGGGISSRPYRAEQVVPFGPEKLEAWEVGFKSDFFDRRARFNVSAFHNKYDDIQLTVRSGTGIFAPPASVTVNAGEAEMTGFEAEFSLNPTSGLTIDAAVGYLDFEYTELSPGVLASGLAMHHVTPFTPEWKWSLGAQYEFALGDGRTITPRFDVAYQSEIYANPVNNPMWVVDDYTVADARVTYRNPTSGVEVALAVTNLFDKYYYTSLYDNLYGSQGTVIANVARPREWSISVRKNF